jgi:hypothetical protein
MNCSTLRRNRLAADLPSTLPPAEARHLAACPACNAWHARLVRLEQRLPALPVPACPVPADLLAQIRTPALRLAGRHRPSSRPRNLQGGRQKLALAFSLAASLAIFAVGWWAWPQLPPDRPVVASNDAYQKKVYAQIVGVKSPAERAGRLADLADKWFAEARQKPDDPARLAVLAGDFDRLVHEDLILHVRQVAPGDQQRLAADLRRRLGHVESEAARLSVEWQSRHVKAVASLQRIAASAREADKRLRLFVS